MTKHILRYITIVLLLLLVLLNSASVPQGLDSSYGTEYFQSDTGALNNRGNLMFEDIQGRNYLSDRIVFRIRDEWAAYSKAKSINHEAFNKTLASINTLSVRKVFPYHLAPAEKVHPDGEELADLSLIYEVELAGGQCLDAAIQALYKTGMVVYAEPKYLPGLLHVYDDEPGKLFVPDDEPGKLFVPDDEPGKLFVPDDEPGKLFVPDDSLLFTQYYLDNIQAYAAWAVARGDTHTVIGIVDTGNDFFHPDLVHSVKYNYKDPINGEDSDNDGFIDNFYGWDLGQGNNNPQYNAHGHGVHVSGTASATANNGLGIAGTGFHSRYLPVKVDDAFGRLVKAYEGIVYAADQGATVINCSWGGPLRGGDFGKDIVRYATINKDALIVAGAGNAANNRPFYPASYDYVLGIAATDSLDRKWDLSSYGSHIGLAAPGVRLLSTWPDSMYIRSSGTSMSAPVVAGAAAIVRSHFPELTALQVTARMQATADPIDTINGNEAYAGQLGPGRLNMYRALADEFTPYIRVTENSLTGNGAADLSPGMTVAVALRFQNMLAPAENMSATINTASPFVTIEDSALWLGPLQTLETTGIHQNTYHITISPDMPPNHLVKFDISFADHDGTPAGKHRFQIVMNTDYLNISSGRLQTTITSKGNIGYNYPDYSTGSGLIYDRDFTRVKCAGFIYGNDPDRVVDNIYGAAENSFSEHFTTVNTVQKLQHAPVADIETIGRFSDRAIDSLSYDIETSHHTYFWENEAMDHFFIKEYLMVNMSEQTYAGMYAGFFADWTSRDDKRMLASYDKTHALAYTFLDNQKQENTQASEQGRFAGVQILTGKAVSHYAFDNDGHNGSIQINKGFDSRHKFAAMESQRTNAGSYRAANDVSSLLSAGPFDLLPGDTARVAFAFHMADSYTELKESAVMAFDAYNKLILGDGTIDVKHPDAPGATMLSAYPNPFGTGFHVTISLAADASNIFKDPEARLLIHDMSGRVVYQKLLKIHLDVPYQYTIDASHLKPGYYLLSIKTQSALLQKKLLKYQ